MAKHGKAIFLPTSLTFPLGNLELLTLFSLPLLHSYAFFLDLLEITLFESFVGMHMVHLVVGVKPRSFLVKRSGRASGISKSRVNRPSYEQIKLTFTGSTFLGPLVLVLYL